MYFLAVFCICVLMICHIVECDLASQRDPHMADTAGSLRFIPQILNLSASIKRPILLPGYFLCFIFLLFFGALAALDLPP